MGYYEINAAVRALAAEPAAPVESLAERFGLTSGEADALAHGTPDDLRAAGVLPLLVVRWWMARGGSLPDLCAALGTDAP